jgi:hypothetical protein
MLREVFALDLWDVEIGLNLGTLVVWLVYGESVVERLSRWDLF